MWECGNAGLKPKTSAQGPRVSASGCSAGAPRLRGEGGMLTRMGRT